MLAPLERMKVWFAVRIGWRVPGKLPDAIRGFQATEADGVWHLLRGIERIDDPKLKAIVFAHSLEEESHAEEFVHAFAQYADRAMQPPSYERKALYPPGEPGWKSFAYVHVGEADATARFRWVERDLEPGPLKTALAKVVRDEEGHVDLTRQTLVRMGATEAAVRRELRRVRLLRLWEGWLRAGKRVIDAFATLLLSLVYFVVGPFVFLAARASLRRRVVDYDNNRLKRL